MKDAVSMGKSPLAQPPHRRHPLIGQIVAGLKAQGQDETEHTVYISSCLRWAECGFQRVIMPQKYAAALMATDPAPAEETRMPWPAFEIQFGNAFISIHGHDVTGLLCCEMPLTATTTAYTLVAMCSATRWFSTSVARVESVAELSASTFNFMDESERSEERAWRVLRRLFVNTCVAIAQKRSESSDNVKRTKKSAMGEKLLTVYKLGHPLDLDVRQDIRDYISGSGTSEPKCTTLVRGHWRNQAHGPGHALRKLIWVMPFYRGQGPLLVRPTLLGVSAQEAV